MLECSKHKGTLLQNWTRYASAGVVTSIYCPLCSPELYKEHYESFFDEELLTYDYRIELKDGEDIPE